MKSPQSQGGISGRGHEVKLVSGVEPIQHWRKERLSRCTALFAPKAKSVCTGHGSVLLTSTLGNSELLIVLCTVIFTLLIEDR